MPPFLNSSTGILCNSFHASSPKTLLNARGANKKSGITGPCIVLEELEKKYEENQEVYHFVYLSIAENSTKGQQKRQLVSGSGSDVQCANGP